MSTFLERHPVGIRVGGVHITGSSRHTRRTVSWLWLCGKASWGPASTGSDSICSSHQLPSATQGIRTARTTISSILGRDDAHQPVCTLCGPDTVSDAPRVRCVSGRVCVCVCVCGQPNTKRLGASSSHTSSLVLPSKVSIAELELYGVLKTLQTASKHCVSPPTQLAPSGLEFPGWHFGDCPSSTNGSWTWGSAHLQTSKRQANQPLRPQLSVTLLLAVVLMLRGKGSKSPPYQRLCQRIRRLVRKENWHLRVHWMTTEANLLCEGLSRGGWFCPLPQ